MSTETKQPTEDFLRSIDVHELLPQQEPFVMIDRLVLFDMTKTVTETTISEKNIFVEEGCFTSSGLIENIAQTCAARIGYINKYILEKKNIEIGFIGAIRQMEIYDLPEVGQTIHTIVAIKEEIFNMTLAMAQVKVGERIIAKTEMKIAMKRE